MMLDILRSLSGKPCAGGARGIVSICSAQPLVIEAGLRHARLGEGPILIEATCNQVNHLGGYTGMTPADFRRFVEDIAERVGFPRERILLGGDHLGPNPWRGLSAEEAMARAEMMVEAYVEAGFRKIHLDASMGCKGEPEAVGDALAAKRAVRLAAVSERAAVRSGGDLPLYVIGTEVPTPGGALEALDHVVPTSAEAAIETHRIHADAFAAAGLSDAFERVIALVVQPGVEFGDEDVVHYDRGRASALSGALSRLPGMIFEAHSTDYQSEAELAALVDDGFRILKVGPWLTFALREALYGLDAIAEDLGLSGDGPSLKARMEAVMLADPAFWTRHYAGSEADLAVKRHYSFSDRIRYYWPLPEARDAVRDLFARLDDVVLPLPLVSQHLGRIADRVERGSVAPFAHNIARAAVERVLDLYAAAAAGNRNMERSAVF